MIPTLKKTFFCVKMVLTCFEAVMVLKVKLSRIEIVPVGAEEFNIIWWAGIQFAHSYCNGRLGVRKLANFNQNYSGKMTRCFGMKETFFWRRVVVKSTVRIGVDGVRNFFVELMVVVYGRTLGWGW